MLAVLKKILSKEEISQLSQSLIITTKNGYELFGEYSINPVKDKFIVKNYTTHLSKTFFSLQNAVVWTTMDKRNRIADSQRISDLDMLLEGSLASIKLHEHLCKSSKTLDSRAIYFIKLQEERLKKEAIHKEISSFILETKRWQDRQFKLATK